MSRDDARRAADILEAIDAIALAVEVMNSHDADDPVKAICLDAITYRVFTIGEATKAMSTAATVAHPKVPWSNIARMRRRKDGLTLFLDLATLEPWDDQWTFLSTLDRLSPGDARRIARTAPKVAVGTEVTSLDRSRATKVHPHLPPVVHAELSAGLTLRAAELTPAALATFKHTASMAKPKF